MKREVAWWTYAVTLNDAAYTKADADGAAIAVEYKLQDFLSDLMDCNRPGGRRLQEQLGIVGVDNLPDDLFQEGEWIASTDDICGISTLDCMSLTFVEQNVQRQPATSPALFTWER